VESQKSLSFAVTPDEYNFEINETSSQYMEETTIVLKIMKPAKTTIVKDIFKCADFWMSKGVLIQTKKSLGDSQDQDKDSNNIALDYYLSGVKIDPQHFGCVYNVACSYYFEKKYLNALKWFELAIKIDSSCQDSYFGKAATCLKLGRYQEAISSI
jgi:tetratricopeptide (TPR) repeat protein